MSLSDEQWEFLQDVSKLILYAKGLGVKLTGGELQRTEYQQEEHIRNGVSKTMDSYHIKKLAIDLNLFVDGEIQWNECKEWAQLGYYWESLNSKNSWGGNWKSFKDLPHFERRA
jgi:hypothetical protein